MLSELGRRPMIGSFDDELEKEIGALLRDQGRQEADERERELNLYRSGSAPPTVEGSLSAVNGFSEFARKNGNGVMSEEDLRSDPAYLSYYYSNANLNPRLPPPLLSKEDWRSAQRLQGGSSVLGGIGDRRKLSRNESNGPSRPLGSLPPGFPARKEGREVEVEKMAASAEWGRDGLIGLSGIGLGSRQKSIAEILQDDLSRSSPNSRHPSRPTSRNAFDENLEALSGADAELANLCQDNSNAQGSSVSYSYAAALGAPLSRSTTPDPQHVPRVPSPCPAPIGGGRTVASQNTFNESVNLAAALSSMNLSSNGRADGEIHLPSQNAKAEHAKASVASFVKGSRPANLNGNLSPHYGSMDGMNPSYSNQGMGGFSLNSPLSPMMVGQLGNLNLPPLLENVMGMGVGMDSVGMGGGSPYGHNLNFPMESDNLGRAGNLPGNAGGFVDPVYLQHLRTMEYAAQVAGLGNHSPDRSHSSNAYLDSLQKAYQLRLGNKSGVGNRGYFGNHSYGVGMGYHGSPMASPVIPNSPVGPGSPLRHNEFNMRYPNAARNMGGGAVGPWHVDGGFGSSLLEEFKSNKTKCFELVDIVGHVVEFSADQYGSRFIQQKLETASIEEKNMVFLEIISKALSLMTDVFGNYVVQKFFEHGMPNQRRELANKLDGHVLTLSLQMYGCRVIQKAIEVVDMDQKIRMVKELDGHIMRCVRDQNGNHVIQKCIECVPEEAIQFIIESFFDQVVNLSTHPYGCRVIQRVLEHCKDEDTQNKVMEEILGSVTMLAQDQYGNYVVQHVLEHGKPHERSFIIKELAGKIVQMSQQKFASNVIEKCLAFGDLEERELMVNEMLGTTDENEPLQAMMKDQFANYVVQKVLETCNDQQLELIMSRIKVHLNALKKYTYGKHIVARVEKLLAAGERRAGMSQNPAA